MESEFYYRAVRLFNAASFYDAHEVWEDVWRTASQPERKFLQGLIQVAVALHHCSTGNLVGARSLLARAHKNLEGYPDKFGGLQLAPFLNSVKKWQDALAEGKTFPPLPQLY